MAKHRNVHHIVELSRAALKKERLKLDPKEFPELSKFLRVINDCQWVIPMVPPSDRKSRRARRSRSKK